MAVDTKAYSGHQFRLAIAKQSAFGTRNSTQTEFQELFLTNRPEVASSVVEDNTKRADGSTVHSVNDRYRTTAGGEYTIPIEGILTKETAAYLFYAAYQILTSEGASTPYAKLFTLGTAVTVPANPNFVFTTLIYDPSGQNIELQDCVLSSLTLAFSPGSGGGRITFSGTIYSGHIPDYDSVTATVSDWDAPGTNYYGISSLDRAAYDVGGGDVDLVMAGWSYTVANGAKRFGFDADGNAQGIAIAAGTAGWTITGELMAKYDDNTESMYTYFMGGNAWSTYITYNSTTTSDLAIVFNARYTGDPKKDFGNDAGVFVTIPFEGVYSGSTPALTVTVEDGVDRTW